MSSAKRREAAADGESAAGVERGWVRYVGPPREGVHPLLGGVRAGGVYECDAATAAALIETGEFERADEPRKE